MHFDPEKSNKKDRYVGWTLCFCAGFMTAILLFKLGAR